MEENVIQVDGGIMINVDVSVKKSCMSKRFRLASIMDDSAIICDEITASLDEEKKNYSNKFS